MRHSLVCLCFIFFLLTAANSQVQSKPLSNKDVIEMVSIGLSDDVIIEKIRSVKLTNFDTSVEGLKSLKAAKVSDAVLKALIQINPHGSPNAVRDRAGQLDGRALAARAVDSMGGLAKLQAVKSLSLDFAWTPKPPQGQRSVQVKTIVVFPDRIRVERELSEGRFTSVVTPEIGFVSAPGTGLRDMTAEEKTDGLSELHRHLVYVAQHLNDLAFTFSEAGSEKLGDSENRIVDVQGPGVWVRWFINPQTGRIVREGYVTKDRTATADLEEWKTSDGLTLPYVREYGEGTVQYNSIQVNPTVDNRIFERPAASTAGQDPLAHTVASLAGMRGDESTAQRAERKPASSGVVSSERQGARDDTTLRSIAYAIRGTSDIRNIMLDPTSFTVLQVIAITKLERDGRTSFRGCVHYVGSNSLGGRLQRWGGYSVNKKGQLNSWPGNDYTHCYINKNEVQTDLTAEVLSGP